MKSTSIFSGGSIFSRYVELCVIVAFTLVISSPLDEPYVKFTDSSFVFGHMSQSGLAVRTIGKELKKTAALQRQKRFEQILDSVGFFNYTSVHLDDTVVVYPGSRAVVKGELIHGAGVDSVTKQINSSIRYPYFYNATNVELRAHQIVSALSEIGYPYAMITLELKALHDNPVTTNDTFLVLYTIRKNEYCISAPPIISGVKYTKQRIISNDIIIRDGDPFNQRSVNDSRRRLKSRAYIREVQIYPPEILPTQNALDTAVRVVTPIKITDKSGIGFDGAIGAAKSTDEKPELNGRFSFSMLNLFHTGENARLGYFGDKQKQQLEIAVSKPWIFNFPLEISIESGLEIVKQQYGFIHGTIAVHGEPGGVWRTGVAFDVNETTVSTDSIGKSGHFYGVSLLISEAAGEYVRGEFGHQMSIRIGSGISEKEKQYTRTQLGFDVGIHVPFLFNQAVVTQIFTRHCVTSEELLLPVEMTRIGGNSTLRGYTDNEYMFRTVLNGQLEYRHYIDGLGSVYIFTDGGIGDKGRIGIDNHFTKLLGYGTGINVPARFGTMTLEWARNIQDTRRNWGRIHIRFKNQLL